MNEWEAWRIEQEARQRKAAPPPAPKKSKEPAPTRLITTVELVKIKRLRHVRTAWWCGDRRFIDQFKDANEETQLTERQAWYISILWYKYRRQIGHNGPRPAGYMENNK